MNQRLGWIDRCVLQAAGLALALAACGGGGDLAAPHAAPTAAAAPAPIVPAATVQIEGCVVDDWFLPRGQTPVRALGADGRLLGNAQSNERGIFRLNLPTGQSVSLAIDRPDG
jgi:hypothetical protein